jgi:Double zinc ribbon
METIRDFIEWFSSETLSAFATIFPYLLFGLVGLYLLWVLIGYLRVSQVGVRDARTAQPVIALPSGGEAGEAGTEALPRPRGVPYCAFDGLQYPPDARFCTQCERDLQIDCTNCGATVSASDTSCYRCGTRTGVVDRTLPA